MSTPEYLGAGEPVTGGTPWPASLTITSSDIPTGVGLVYGDRLVLVIQHYYQRAIGQPFFDHYGGLDSWDLVLEKQGGISVHDTSLAVYTKIWGPGALPVTIEPQQLDDTFFTPTITTDAFYRAQVFAWSPAGDWIPVDDDDPDFPVTRTRVGGVGFGTETDWPQGFSGVELFGLWHVSIGLGGTVIAFLSLEGMPKSLIDSDFGDLSYDYDFTQREYTEAILDYGGGLKMADRQFLTTSGFKRGPHWDNAHTGVAETRPLATGVLFALQGSLDDEGWRVGTIG